MPFKECSLLDQREEFCRLALMPDGNVRELCRRWEISPTTGYKWVSRFSASGWEGLSDRSRRPRESPRRTQAALEGAVLAIREENPRRGGRKIERVLLDEGLAKAPSPSTITEILRRHGKLDGPVVVTVHITPRCGVRPAAAASSIVDVRSRLRIYREAALRPLSYFKGKLVMTGSKRLF